MRPSRCAVTLSFRGANSLNSNWTIWQFKCAAQDFRTAHFIYSTASKQIELHSIVLAIPSECHKDAVLASVEAQAHLLLLVPNVTQPIATVGLPHGTDHCAGDLVQFLVLLKAEM